MREKLVPLLVLLVVVAAAQKTSTRSETTRSGETLMLLTESVANWNAISALRDFQGWDFPNTTPCSKTWTGVTCGLDGNVTKLELPGNDLDGFLPPDLLTLPSLRVLNLSNNLFYGQLPPQWNSDTLESLDVSINLLTGPLPVSFGLPQTFPRLRILRLQGNMLDGPLPGAEWTAIGFAKQAQITLRPGNEALCGPVPPIKVDILTGMPAGSLLSDLGDLEGPAAYSVDGEKHSQSQAYIIYENLFDATSNGTTSMVVTNSLGSCAQPCGLAAEIRTNLLEAAWDNNVTLADLTAQNPGLTPDRTRPGTQLAVPCYPARLEPAPSSSDVAANCFAGGNQRSVAGVVGAELAGAVVNGAGLTAPGPFYTGSVQWRISEDGSVDETTVEPVFWFVKLDATFTISAVSITAGDAMRGVQLLVGENANDVFGNRRLTTGLSINPGETKAVVVDPTRGNLVVLYAGRREEGNLSLSRVQVWAMEASAALWKPVMASFSEDMLNLTTDGDDQTCSSVKAVGPNDEPWVSVDLGMEAEVASVVFTVRGNDERGLAAQVSVGTQADPGEVSNATLCGEAQSGTWSRRGGVQCGRRGRYVSIRLFGAEEVDMCELEVFVNDVPEVRTPPRMVSSKTTVAIAAAAAATGAAVALGLVSAALYLRRRRRSRRARREPPADGVAVAVSDGVVGTSGDEERGEASKLKSTSNGRAAPAVAPAAMTKPVQDSFTSTTGMAGFIAALLPAKWRHRSSSDDESGSGSGTEADGSPANHDAAQSKAKSFARTMSHDSTDLTQFPTEKCGEVIDFSQIELVRPIGEGSFGLVYLARHLQTTVAVKVLTQDLRAGPNASSLESKLLSGMTAKPSTAALAALAREACIMASLRHPCCVRYLGACLDPPALVMEYCSRRSVDCILAAAASDPRQAAQLDWLRLLSMATDAAKGLLYLHSRNPAIIHRDLKSPNLLVQADWHVKISDFNVSRVVEEGAALSSLQITNPRWLAPEVLRGGQALVASDIFAFGVVMWELMTWQLPWGRETNPFQIISAVSGGQSLPVPAADALPAGPLACYGEYVALMQHCWAAEPHKRPPTEEVVQRLRGMLTGIVQGRLEAVEREEQERRSSISPR